MLDVLFGVTIGFVLGWAASSAHEARARRELFKRLHTRREKDARLN